MPAGEMASTVLLLATSSAARDLAKA